MKKNEITPRQAAKMLGVGRPYVYELLGAGLLRGRQVLGRWLIPVAEVNRYQRRHRRIGKTIQERQDGAHAVAA
jgi:excisionase family DNA binding protein